jgi:Rps23 Pro-64 3,4-dihydroxylase Tpa1-like proline 4-hydroxylase
MKERIELSGTFPIVITDDLFTREEISTLYIALLRADYSIIGSSNQATRQFNEVLTEFDIADIRYTSPYDQAVALIRRHWRPTEIDCYEALGVLSEYGDYAFIHNDTSRSGSISVLYYANPNWPKEWEGETIFYNPEKEPFLPIAIKPGRMVAYDSRVLHRAGVPGRRCSEVRLTLSLRFNVQ